MSNNQVKFRNVTVQNFVLFHFCTDFVFPWGKIGNFFPLMEYISRIFLKIDTSHFYQNRHKGANLSTKRPTLIVIAQLYKKKHRKCEKKIFGSAVLFGK